jgi:hypothetical protein
LFEYRDIGTFELSAIFEPLQYTSRLRGTTQRNLDRAVNIRHTRYGNALEYTRYV